LAANTQWANPESSDHYLLVYKIQPYNCNTGSYAVYCIPFDPMRDYGLDWFETPQAALKKAELENEEVLALYRVERIDLLKTETTEAIPQEPQVVTKKHYKLAEGAK
jgi:hypothetical protein